MVSRSIAFTAAACQRPGPGSSAGCPRRQQRQPVGRAAAGQPEQRVEVQVLLHQVGQQLEPALAGGREADPRRPPRPAPQPRPPRRGTPHGTRRPRGCRATWCRTPPRTWRRRGTPRHRPAGDPPVVDLVAARRRAQRAARGSREHLVRRELGAHVEQPEPLGPGARLPLDAVRVRDRAAEHLEAAADPEHRPAAPPRAPRSRRRGRARAARPGRRRWPGCRAARRGPRRRAPAGRTRTRRRARLEPERVDVGEVADPRQPHHRDLGSRPPAAASAAGRPGRARPRCRATGPGSQGSTPSTGRPVSRSSVSQARARAGPTSPRNLLTTNPPISAWSAGVEERDACRTSRRTRRRGRCRRPRTTGIPACRARPMFT